MKMKSLILFHKFLFAAGCCAMFFHGMTHAYAVKVSAERAEASILRALPVSALGDIIIGDAS